MLGIFRKPETYKTIAVHQKLIVDRYITWNNLVHQFARQTSQFPMPTENILVIEITIDNLNKLNERLSDAGLYLRTKDTTGLTYELVSKEDTTNK